MSNVQTIDRLHMILNCFSEQEPQLSMTEISQRIGLTTSTTHRLMSSMEQHGMLSRSPDGKAYLLGYRFTYWASIVEKSNTLQKQARPLLESLSKTTGETAVLMIRDSHWAVCIDRVDSSQSLRLAMDIGKRIPLHAGSSAKIFLAFMPQTEIEAYIENQGLPQVATNTITDKTALLKELAQVREAGYATSFEERDPDAAGLTVPIFNGADQIIAAIGIVGPVSRLTSELMRSHLPILKATAEKLSQ